MALISPGVEVSVVDESQFIPSATNSVPYFLVATAQNKVSSDGVTVAAGTLAANANKTYLITSQRDLAATFGVPFFYNTTTGTPINGYELNEYGLLAAYSALGVTNRAYVQRVNIDLTQLSATLSRPTGTPENAAAWLDLSNTVWGIQEWNRETNTFTVKTPLAITDPADMTDPENLDLSPLSTIGSIGDYAVSFYQPYISGFYKNNSNNWVAIGSDAWKLSWPTVQGTATPVSLTIGANILINGTLCTVGATNTVTGFAAVINGSGITGVTAANVGGKLALYADSTASNDGSTADGGVISIVAGPNSGSTLLTQLGIADDEYGAPEYLPSYSYQAPRWRLTDSLPKPTGSVWNNMSSANNGINVVFKRYDAALGAWVAQSTPAYLDDIAALYGLSPGAGGANLAVNRTYISYDALSEGSNNATMVFEILQRVATGATVITGNELMTGTPFAVGNQFTLSATAAGQSALNTATVTISGTGTAADFVAAVSAANVPHVSASVDSDGFMVFVHSQGGTIYLDNITGQGTPIADAGFTSVTPGVRVDTQVSPTPGGVILSNWGAYPAVTYTASASEPTVSPTNGTLWYYSTATEADIMIQNNGNWVGYKTVTNDVRGFNLTLTNAAGPIFASTAPTTQTNTAASPLQPGDLWIDTSDLENYPKLYRWEPVDNVNQWVAVDTADQVSQNGVLFADARWATNGSTDPIEDPIPSIVSLLTSNYLDLDAPDSTLYPQGMLLWNTRRSGYNVKSFRVNYFSQANFPDAQLPAEPNAWVTASGNRADGAMYGGRLAQRQMIVQALRSGIDTSVGAREESTEFNLMACPGYPELITNMVALSNERNNTVFVVGDTPMRLPGDATAITNWRTNNNGNGLASGDGLDVAGSTTFSPYLATFWPSCQTSDLSGNTVVAPPSHMMVRTILRNDEVAYPWLAPAGTRRGVVDNASAIGYIDSATGEFVQVGVNQGLRDVLYNQSINPVTFVPGVGITNFGNKTSTTVTSALDRINVARLVAFLRQRLDQIGKLYLFEPNDQITRNEITNTINSLMIDLIAKRAIYDYLVVCDLSNNTPARIDRNELWVDIAIEPVKAVEFIYIPLRIKNTGEISGTAA